MKAYQACIDNDLSYIQEFSKYDSLPLTPVFVDTASEHGNVEVMRWLLERKMPYTSAALDNVGCCGCAQLFVDFKLPLLYTSAAMDDACSVELLDWMKAHLPTLRYTDGAMDLASEKCLFDVLDWWLDSGLVLKYSATCIDTACFEGALQVLRWWKASGLPLKYRDCVMMECNPKLFKWWLDESEEPMQLYTIGNYSTDIADEKEAAWFWYYRYQCDQVKNRRRHFDWKLPYEYTL